MAKGFFPAQTILLSPFQASFDEILAFLRNTGIEGYRPVHDVVDELKLILGRPGSASMEKLVVDESD